MKYRQLSLSFLAVFLLGIGFAPAAAQAQLLVFAAASLTDAFEEIAAEFEGQNATVDVVFNFGSSSTLAAQLSQGASADVFASANNTQMNIARDAERTAGSPRTFVKNRLVLIVPADNPANIQSLRDLANPGIRLVLAAPNVPVRDYTNTMLDRLAADPAYGEPYRETVIANIVSEEDNVRQVSAKIALGEGDAGIIYRSDVTPDIAESVTVIPIPDSLNTIATYPIAVTNDSANPELAQTFVDFVLGDTGQAILVKWGFISVQIPELPPTVSLPNDGTVSVDGQVLNPLSLTVDNLRSDFSSHTLEVTYLSGEDTITTSFTGVLLWDILSAAQPNFNADVRNDKLSMFIVVSAGDHYQAVIAWGEIDPEFGNQPILLAYEQEDAPLANDQGLIRLVVPGDTRDGRYVSGVLNISLRDAPAVGN